MTDGRSRGTRTAADLRWMRGSTIATLCVLILVGAFLQLVLGVDGDVDLRMALLIASTITSVAVGLAVVPLLVRTSAGISARHPFVIALLAAAGFTWMLALLAPFAGWGWGFLFAIAGGMLSCIVPRWWSAAVLVATIGVLTIGGHFAARASPTPTVSPATADGTDLAVISALVLLTFTPLSAIWVLRVVLRLDDARQLASDLAVATERLRFATDLHDIQGHHLQVIALKGELAERRLLSDQIALAASDLADIRVIAQSALEDTRAVVNDYRTVTVAVEARNAAAVLRSAGIHCDARIESPDLPTAVGAVFAMAIREAATNILRHSSATEASLELVQTAAAEYRLTVANNGAGALRRGGTGLAGLGERVAAWNGTVETSRRDGTFTLIVSVPAHSGAPSVALEAER